MKCRIVRFPTLASLAAMALLTSVAARAAEPADLSSKKININQASAAQLSNLPRVGGKVADRIVEYRKAHGQFGQAEELMEVKGVGERLFKELRPYVALSGPTTLTSKVSSKGTRGGSSGKKSASVSASSKSVSVGKGR